MSYEIQDGHCGILVIEPHEFMRFGIVLEKEDDPRSLLLQTGDNPTML